MEIKRTARFLVLASVMVLTLSSCSGLIARLPGGPEPVPRQPDSPEITRILMQFQSRNQNLRSLKGVGRIKIRHADQTQTARTAWTVARPDKIRILILAVTGFPLASLAADGQAIYVMSHSDNRFYQKETGDASLEPMLNLPIRSREIIELALGGLPVRDHWTSSRIEDPVSDRTEVTLTDRYGQPCQILFLNSVGDRLNRIEFFDGSGNLEYRVVYEDWKDIDGYRIPYRMGLNNDQEIGIQLDMEKIWIDPPVSADLFVLSPP